MINHKISHYRIVDKIGEGGMGVVYHAWDEKLHRDVALKFLPVVSPKGKRAQERLVGEARAASALNHPHICTIYEVDEADGEAYIAMEYVEGRPLSKQIPADGLSAEAVVRYGAQIADALAHAHDHGVVHRDLKSANVIITPEGRVKVLDFGLAKREVATQADVQTRSAASLTPEGAVVGTLHYIAPEVFRGEPADARSDIWALGVVLYEMAAGKWPFRANTAYELSSAILRESPAPIPRALPPALPAVIDRCLAKEPGQRYQHASEVRAALETIGTSTAILPLDAKPSATPGTDLLSRRVMLISAAVLGALLLVFLGLRLRARKGRIPGGPPQIQSLAVLPLENLSGDPKEDYFADGMTEELTTQLAQISALRVISRTSVMRYKGSHKALPEIAKELHVEAVVEGSVMRSGDRVRITAQLIQASTDKNLWAQGYERDLKDVLSLQDEVAEAIVNEIEVKLTPQEQARLTSARPLNPAAHEAYLRGRYHLTKVTEQQFKEARKYFEQAAALDANYAPAYSGLADTFWATDELPPRVAKPKSEAYVLKALALDDTLADAHTTLAFIRFYGDWDWLGAEKEFRRALELSPSDAEAHRRYSVYLSVMGRAEEALTEIRTAQVLDPLSVDTSVSAGWALYNARQYDQALEQCQRALELDANSAGVYDCLGSAYLAKGMYQQAVGACQRAVELSQRDPARVVGLGRAYALSGRAAEAHKVLEELRQLSKDIYVPPYFLAAINVALGQSDEAFLWLEKSYRQHDNYLAWLQVDSALDPLRPDPRFQTLLRRVGFPP